MSDRPILFSAPMVRALIERSRIDVSTEGAAHDAIFNALVGAGLAPEREVVLSPGSRIDLLVGSVGIEIKVKGSRRAIMHQLERYAAEPCIEALVLATGGAWPTMAEVNGKPLFVASLARGWL